MARAHEHHPQVPKPALYVAVSMIAFAFLAALLAQTSGIGALRAPAPDPVEERVLSFSKLEGDAIAVRDMGADRQLVVLGPEENGFIRGVLRGLDHERRIRGVASETPYRLIRSTDGRLSLVDAATDRRVELIGFGQDNFNAFAQLLSLGRDQ